MFTGLSLEKSAAYWMTFSCPTHVSGILRPKPVPYRCFTKWDRSSLVSSKCLTAVYLTTTFLPCTETVYQFTMSPFRERRLSCLS